MKKYRAMICRCAVIFLAVILLCWFSQTETAHQLRDRLSTKEALSTLFYLGTGQMLSFGEDTPAVPEETLPENRLPLHFTAQEAQRLSFANHAGVSFDAAALLTKPLEWDLYQSQPTVLIYHSHTSESYRNTEGYTESSAYRTLDEAYNMLSIGDLLAQRLEEAGITVIHDRTVHDYPSYNSAYDSSERTVQQYLQQYPSIRLVLDIHRDAYLASDGSQATDTVIAKGVSSSRLMILAGSDRSSWPHPNWQENLALAVKLQTALEQMYPGLCRPICIRSSSFNQNLSPGALLVEIGTAGDTRQNALAAADCLADGIIALASGAQ